MLTRQLDCGLFVSDPELSYTLPGPSPTAEEQAVAV